MSISVAGNISGRTHHRGRLSRFTRNIASDYRTAFWLMMAVATVLVLLTFQDYGVTWDEQVQNDYGQMVLNYYLSGFRDTRALSYFDLWLYGGFFDSIAALVNKISPFGEYETRHLLNALVGLFGIVGCWKLGRQYGSERIAFWSAALLLLIPTWYGQMFNNPKDIPFAVFFVWSLAYIAEAIPLLPRPPLRLNLKLGLMVGLCLGVRVGGLLLLIYMGVVGLSFLWLRYREAPERYQPLADLRDGLLHWALPVVLVAYPVMLLFWPWAQSAPFSHPIEAMRRFSELPQQIQVLFAGHHYTSDHLPWYYLPATLAIKVPEVILAAVSIGAVLGLLRLTNTGWHFARTAALRAELLALAVLWPIAFVIAAHAHMFDGMRHFIFLLPPIAAVAAISLDRLLDSVARFRHLLMAVYAGLAFYILSLLSVMVALHPDQYVYYNQLVGGVDDAAGRFETDYWGNSLAEAVHALETDLQQEYGRSFADHRFKVMVCADPFSAKYFFPKNFELAQSSLQADFYIGFTRYNCDKSLKGLEIYRVEKAGATLAVVLDRRYLKAHPVAQR